MNKNKKPLDQQVFFITGASRGIGLATARLAVEQGSKVFLVARDEGALKSIQEKMQLMGYETDYAVCDVAIEDELKSAVEKCINKFGRIDTFVNNAGITVYDSIADMSIEEARRVFETNFWGVVNGSRVAIPVLKKSHGTLINIGSVLSEVAIPIQGIYSASKFAVRGFTTALRRELLDDKDSVQVSLITPSAINIIKRYEMNQGFGALPLSGKVHSVDLVGKAILRAATSPKREIRIGWAAHILPFMERMFPRIQDRIMANYFMENKQRERLLEPKTRKEFFPGHLIKSSLVSELSCRRNLLSSGAKASALVWLFINKRSPDTNITS